MPLIKIYIFVIYDIMFCAALVRCLVIIGEGLVASFVCLVCMGCWLLAPSPKFLLALICDALIESGCIPLSSSDCEISLFSAVGKILFALGF